MSSTLSRSLTPAPFEPRFVRLKQSARQSIFYIGAFFARAYCDMQIHELLAHDAGKDHPPYPLTYSFCTLVTDFREYTTMLESFASKGFSVNDCEFLYLDNTRGNAHDAYSGYNLLMRRARGKYIVLCHQDIELIGDERIKLDNLLAELTNFDPYWALCGNSGADENGHLTIRISDPYGKNRKVGGPYPSKVVSLDENFIIVRRDANLGLSRDLHGFHWYGTDLCLVADILGWNSYVIDFHLKHKSAGYLNEDFYRLRLDLRRTLGRAFRPRWQYGATLRPFYITSNNAVFFISEQYLRTRTLINRILGSGIRATWKLIKLFDRMARQG